MQLTDWVTITSAIIGVFSGAGISWIFFRTQLLADVRSLREKLLEMDIRHDVGAIIIPETRALYNKLIETHKDLQQLDANLDLMAQIDRGMDLATIKITVKKLDKDLSSAVREILNNVKGQQIELANRIQETYKSQVITARDSVSNSFSTEINKFVRDSVDREKLLANLVRSFMDGMRVMGDYQRQNIEKETLGSISDIEEKITRSVDEIVEEVYHRI